MKIYNKTVRVLTYGNDRFVLEVPASNTAGSRGSVVEVTKQQHLAIHLSYVAFLADFKAGNIEVEE